MASNEVMIKIHIMGDIPLVWDVKELQKLRKHRVSGTMDGPIAEGAHDKTRGLPMSVMKEAALYMKELGLAELVDYPQLYEEPTKEINSLVVVNEHGQLKLQEHSYHDERRIRIEQMADKIFKSVKEKNAKLDKSDPKYIPENELTRERVIQDKIKAINPPKRGTLCIEMFQAQPFIDRIPHVPATELLKFPITLKEKIRYAAYKDLYEKGYWILDGRDIGLDFLLYKGDPAIVHAKLAVKVVASDVNKSNTSSHATGVCVKDFIVNVRSAEIMKAKLLLAFVGENSNVDYKTVSWKGQRFGGVELST